MLNPQKILEIMEELFSNRSQCSIQDLQGQLGTRIWDLQAHDRGWWWKFDGRAWRDTSVYTQIEKLKLKGLL